jgi:hypothetical protein
MNTKKAEALYKIIESMGVARCYSIPFMIQVCTGKNIVEYSVDKIGERKAYRINEISFFEVFMGREPNNATKQTVVNSLGFDPWKHAERLNQ